MIVFSYYTHLDIKLGQHLSRDDLAAAIRNLKYYKGGTYTHEALQVLRGEGLTGENTRSGVTKYVQKGVNGG